MSSEAEGGASTSATPEKDQMDVQTKAKELLAQGKRNLICHEIPTAVQQFQDACQMLASKFGDMAKECAEAYFHYGSALLDLSRMEQGVLGNALEGVDVEADDEGGPNNKDQFEKMDKLDEEERMELRLKVVEAMSEDEISNQALLASGKKPEPGKTSFEGVLKETKDKLETAVEHEEGESSQNQPEDMEAEVKENEAEGSGPKRNRRHSSIETKVAKIAIGEAGDETDGGHGKVETGDSPKQKGEERKEGEEEEEEGEEEEGEAEGEEEEGAGSGEEGEDPDDISNLQLAWETLDLAKIIYSKDPAKESQLKAAEAYLKLGEISLEEERYEQGIGDMEKCLEIQKEHLDPFDRAIAETCYQLGLACQMSKEPKRGREYFASALTCLELKIEKLKVTVEEKPPKSPSQLVAPADSAQREINEILEILPDIKEKIKEVEEESKNMENIMALAKQAMGSIFAAAADSTSDAGFAGTSSSSSTVESTEPQKTLDISHLVRKKRKPEEKTAVEDLENKKPKQEGGSGESAQNGVCEKTDSTSEAVAAT